MKNQSNTLSKREAALYSRNILSHVADAQFNTIEHLALRDEKLDVIKDMLRTRIRRNSFFINFRKELQDQIAKLQRDLRVIIDAEYAEKTRYTIKFKKEIVDNMKRERSANWQAVKYLRWMLEFNFEISKEEVEKIR